MIVTFLGHRDAPSEIQPHLERQLTDLIEDYNATCFYVGNNGNFDRLVQYTLQNLSVRYSQISFFIVLAYLPTNHCASLSSCEIPTIFPEGLEFSHPKYAIAKRNHWMIDHSDCVVAYVSHNFGGASQFLRLAERKKKLIFNLAVPSPK